MAHLVCTLAILFVKAVTSLSLQTLKLMKYIVENGHPNFKLGLIKNSRGIKKATSKLGTSMLEKFTSHL